MAQPRRKSDHYVSGKDFLEEIVKYQKECNDVDEYNSKHQKQKKMPKVNNVLGMMIWKIVKKFSNLPSFNGYSKTDREDMQQTGALTVIGALRKFNPEKSNNAFAFFTQVIKNSFFAWLNTKYAASNFKMQMIEDQFHKEHAPFINEQKRQHLDKNTNDENLQKFFPDS